MLFETEEDNNYEEDIFITQLAGYYFFKILQHKMERNQQKMEQWTTTRADLVFRQLEDCLRKVHHFADTSHALLSQYPTYQREVFLSLYRLSFAAVALTNPETRPPATLQSTSHTRDNIVRFGERNGWSTTPPCHSTQFAICALPQQ